MKQVPRRQEGHVLENDNTQYIWNQIPKVEWKLTEENKIPLFQFLSVTDVY